MPRKCTQGDEAITATEVSLGVTNEMLGQGADFMFDKVLTPIERTALANLLREKYGLPPQDDETVA